MQQHSLLPLILVLSCDSISYFNEASEEYLKRNPPPSFFEAVSVVYKPSSPPPIFHTPNSTLSLSLSLNFPRFCPIIYPGEKMNRPGDWNCRSCQHLNFQRRDSCQRCGEPRPGGDYGSFGGRGSSFGFTGPDVRPGDWYCSVGNCGAHNFASRSSCFKCGAVKDENGSGFDSDISRARGFGFSSSGGRSGWKSGDWICTSCNEHNFASRMECFRCNAPRPSCNSSY